MAALLPDIWFALLSLILLIYVVLDGYDLGVGLLSLLTRDQSRRAVMMASLGNLWHANQTWLVIFAGLLFGAFPAAYGLVLSALYLPILGMLLGFILRGVSFEFHREAQWRLPWQLAFAAGSLLAALSQGLVLGGLLSGLPVASGQFAGGVWDWLNPFAVLIALGLACGYALLGATYLIIKTDGEVQGRSYQQALAAAVLVLIAILGASLWAYLGYPFLTPRWFAWPPVYLTVLVLLLAGLVRSLRQKRREPAPMLWSLAVFGLSFFSLAASLYPCLIPPGLTIAAAASPTNVLLMMLIVVGLILPVILIYNGYQFAVFRGKVADGGYGED
jgi:cytochrome bd ubiquinol oxidase subunit II